MVELVQQFEERVTQLIAALETCRVTRNQLEKENDGLKVTLADYEDLQNRLRAAEKKLGGATATETDDDLEALREENERLREQLDLAQTNKTKTRKRLDSLIDRLQSAEVQLEQLELAHETA